MARRKAHTPEEIVAKLRQVEVLVGQGKSVAEAVRSIGVTEPSYYLYGLLPLRKRSLGWVRRPVCVPVSGVSRLPPAPEWQIRTRGPQPMAGLGGGRDRSQALRASA